MSSTSDFTRYSADHLAKAQREGQKAMNSAADAASSALNGAKASASEFASTAKAQASDFANTAARIPNAGFPTKPIRRFSLSLAPGRRQICPNNHDGWQY